MGEIERPPSTGTYATGSGILTAAGAAGIVQPFIGFPTKEFRMIKRLGPGKRLSQASIHGNTVYLAGQVPDEYSGDIKTQTKQVLDKIDALLKEAGTDKTQILSATVWLPDINDRDAMNTIWDAWVPDVGPARACVESKLADPAIKVEIAVIAAIG